MIKSRALLELYQTKLGGAGGSKYWLLKTVLEYLAIHMVIARLTPPNHANMYR